MTVRLVFVTSKQYEEGYYTKREAALSVLRFRSFITFSLVIIKEVGLQHLFVPFYLTVSLAGLIAALIMPRIWPLSKKPDVL